MPKDFSWRCLVSALYLAVFAVYAQPQYFLIEPPAGGNGAQIFSLSADGTTAVGHYSRAGSLRPLLWTAEGGSVDIAGTMGGTGEAIRCSADGSVVFGFGIPWGAWRWSATAGIEPLLLPPGAVLVLPIDVSDDGLVLLGWSVSSSTTSFRWTESLGYQSISDAGSNLCALAMAGDGSTIVGNHSGSRTFLWRSGAGISEIPVTSRSVLGSVDLSRGGRFAIGAYGSVGCRYEVQTDSLTLLTWPDGSNLIGQPIGITDSGDTIVGNLPDNRAFVWDAENRARELTAVIRLEYGLDVPELHYIRGMSADGAILAGTEWVVTLRNPQRYRGRPPCQGDVDGDQRVGLSDLLFVLGEWRRPEPDLAADITGDGIVDQLDLNIVLVDFGDDCARRRIQQAER